MAKQKGRAFLIKIGDGEASEAFTAFAGLTAKSLELNTERVDVTTPGTDPTAAIWRETLDGVKAVNVSGDYTLVDDAQEARAITVAMTTDAACNFEIVVPSVGTFAGAFSVNLSYSGESAVTGSISLESSGAVTFTAAA
jgi:TP901-1 family phage major tail protein